ncbi:GAP family protein [Streptomyces sp. NPDC097981]|uniref:GAP family protein n=1 Tax=Streptomyces sp. NPDC097981 TaxID=3155428 RepID=UPI003320D90C
MVVDLLLIALAITVDPFPIMAFLLAVMAPKGVWRGLVFILAWLACLVAVIAVVLLVTGGEPPAPRSPPGVAQLAAKLVAGLALVGYGLHRRRRLRAGTSGGGTAAADTPTADTEPAAGAAAAGVAAGTVPAPDESGSTVDKELGRSPIWSAGALAVLSQPWGMVAAAATTVMEADASQPTTYFALFGFCLLATASLIAAELYLVFSPQAAQARLLQLRNWMKGHKEQAIVTICLVLGIWLTGKSLFQLTS